jgi:enoyl-CoA hydratase
MNRPEVRNAQNSAMTYALDRCFHEAAMDDEVGAIVLRGAGPTFSAGHDIGSPGRDIHVSFPKHTMWPDHLGKPGIESRMNRESEVFLELPLRWREIPKPTIAAIQGGCIGGGMVLAWVCDLIVASDDAFFADPVVDIGNLGVEYFAHPWQLRPRFAKEFLFLGERVTAARAYEMGMVNRVVPRDDLDATALAIAAKIADRPRFAMTLAKTAVNQAEDAMGLRTGMTQAFALHQLAHAYCEAVSGSPILDGLKSLRSSREADGKAPDR